MKEFGEPARYDDQYTLRSGQVLYYNSSEVMRADPSSEALGVEAALVINALRHLNTGLERKPKVLEAGTGTGIGLAACVAHAKTGVDLYGFDKNPTAVRTTEDNVRRIMGPADVTRQLIIMQADWHNLSERERIAAQGPYDAILFNPPYLPAGADLLPGYDDCPKDAVFSDDGDGLEQYRTVIPWLSALLSEKVGATIIIRRPMSSDTDPVQTIGILEGMTRYIPPGKQNNGIICMSYLHGAYVSPDRELAMTILSRAAEGSGLPPYADPLINGSRSFTL